MPFSPSRGKWVVVMEILKGSFKLFLLLRATQAVVMSADSQPACTEPRTERRAEPAGRRVTVRLGPSGTPPAAERLLPETERHAPPAGEDDQAAGRAETHMGSAASTPAGRGQAAGSGLAASERPPASAGSDDLATTTTAEPQHVCSICSESYRSAQGLVCSAPEGTGHFTCGLCLGRYIVENCSGPTGLLERSVTGGGPNRDSVSPEGALPCTHFMVGCPCGALPFERVWFTLADVRAVSGSMAAEAMLSLFQSQGRVAVETSRQAEQAAAEAAVRAAQDRVAGARTLVQHALEMGQHVVCPGPGCGLPTRKDDRCMHMRCPRGHSFCYVCGRSRTPRECPGCDSTSPFLEANPGWTHLSSHEALVEFHLRMMAFYVSVAREMMGEELWAELRVADPRLLDDVLEGRSITVNPLRSAVEPPCFGNNAANSAARRREADRRRQEARRRLEELAAVALRQPAAQEGDEGAATAGQEDLVAQFCQFTGADVSAATRFLSESSQNLAAAVFAFFGEDGWLPVAAPVLGAARSSASGIRARPAASGSSASSGLRRPSWRS